MYRLLTSLLLLIHFAGGFRFSFFSGSRLQQRPGYTLTSNRLNKLTGYVYPRYLTARSDVKVQADADAAQSSTDGVDLALSEDFSRSKHNENSNMFLITEDTNSTHCKQVDVSEFNSRWMDYCIDQNRPEDWNRFTLREVMSLIHDEITEKQKAGGENAFFFYNLGNKSLELHNSLDSGDIFITAQELEKLWRDSSTSPFRGQEAEFSAEAALLLIDDEDDELLMGDTAADVDAAESSAAMESYAEMEQVPVEDLVMVLRGASADDAIKSGLTQVDVPVYDETDVEYVITEQELMRLWQERSVIEWGCPSAEFDPRASLLLTDDDDQAEEDYYKFLQYGSDADAAATATAGAAGEDSDTEEDIQLTGERAAGGAKGIALLDDAIAPASPGLSQYLPTNQIILDDPKQGFWKRFRGRSFQNLRDTLRRIYQSLEEHEYYMPPWKKMRRFLTPDIDTQDFLGDMMFSNTQMTRRIPANWDDPDNGDRSRMRSSKTYMASGIMAMPGDPIVDFTEQQPVWEVLKLPIGPSYDYDRGLEAKLIKEFAEERGIPTTEFDLDEERGSEADPNADDGVVNWDEFDFAKAEEGAVGSDSVDSMFLDALSEEDQEEDSAASASVTVFDNEKHFDDPKFADYVGFEEWSKYDSKYFEDADNYWWDEDVYLAKTVQFLNQVWPIFLEDHTEVNADYEQRIAWERTLDEKFGVRKSFQSTLGKNTGARATRGSEGVGTIIWQKNDDSGEELVHDCEFAKEEVPMVWVPDINRGIDYTNEVYELKGTKSLKPWRPPLHVEFANDTFFLSEDSIAINRIGTIREQYDWQPRADLEHKIDSKVQSKIQPVLKYLNHIATLQSTKDDIFIFDYHGRLCDIIGIRASAMQIGKECYPKLKDLRLETTRKVDKKALK